MKASPVCRIDPARPAPDVIDAAVGALRAGGVIAYPTETLYGLGADALSPAAVERVFSLKGRPEGQPILVLVADDAMLETIVARVSHEARALADAFWPGPLTLVLDAASSVPREITGGAGGVGVRISSHPVAAALAAGLGRPITSTSANRSGRAGARSARDVTADFPEGLDLVLDTGPLADGPPSTVLDLTGHRARIVRAGVIGADAIRRVLGTACPVVER